MSYAPEINTYWNQGFQRADPAFLEIRKIAYMGSVFLDAQTSIGHGI